MRLVEVENAVDVESAVDDGVPESDATEYEDDIESIRFILPPPSPKLNGSLVPAPPLTLLSLQPVALLLLAPIENVVLTGDCCGLFQY